MHLEFGRKSLSKIFNLLIIKKQRMQKRAFLLSVIGAAVMSATGFVGYHSYKMNLKTTESNLLYENIEALANDNEGGYGTVGEPSGGDCFVEVNDSMVKGRYIECYNSYQSTYCTPGVCSVNY